MLDSAEHTAVDALEDRYWRALMDYRHRYGGSRKQRRAARARRKQFIRWYRAECRRTGCVPVDQQMILAGRGGSIFGTTADTSSSYGDLAGTGSDCASSGAISPLWNITARVVMPHVPRWHDE